jgi:hypothetical protein
MSVRTIACLPVIALVAACFLAAGCISTTVGDASYRNETVFITITNPAGPADAYVQVTVNQVNNLHQEEVAVFGAPVNLTQGENMVSVPGQIGPGQYKLYVYVLQNGERKTAVIRDITV